MTEKKEYKVKGYFNKWYVIDTYKEWALLENATWGEDTCHLVIRKDVEIRECQYLKAKTLEPIMLPTIMEVVCETYDDLITALIDEGVITDLDLSDCD